MIDSSEIRPCAYSVLTSKLPDPTHAVEVSAEIAELVMKGMLKCIYSVRLTARTRYESLLANYPSRVLTKRWIDEHKKEEVQFLAEDAVPANRRTLLWLPKEKENNENQRKPDH